MSLNPLTENLSGPAKGQCRGLKLFLLILEWDGQVASDETPRRGGLTIFVKVQKTKTQTHLLLTIAKATRSRSPQGNAPC